jgi:hypothetical protein
MGYFRESKGHNQMHRHQKVRGTDTLFSLQVFPQKNWQKMLNQIIIRSNVIDLVLLTENQAKHQLESRLSESVES